MVGRPTIWMTLETIATVVIENRYSVNETFQIFDEKRITHKQYPRRILNRLMMLYRNLETMKQKCSNRIHFNRGGKSEKWESRRNIHSLYVDSQNLFICVISINDKICSVLSDASFQTSQIRQVCFVQFLNLCTRMDAEWFYTLRFFQIFDHKSKQIRIVDRKIISNNWWCW